MAALQKPVTSTDGVRNDAGTTAPSAHGLFAIVTCITVEEGSCRCYHAIPHGME